ncbi:protein FAM177A1 [Gracilinanus agilis]|uniref:protein FAM177A1 n=1 Tax=Gracilinanus agilis TaxID=191870 RepID=UPI001CFC8384|nr:protein FAM177A1 [Gracilinanus agilis]
MKRSRAPQSTSEEAEPQETLGKAASVLPLTRLRPHLWPRPQRHEGPLLRAAAVRCYSGPGTEGSGRRRMDADLSAITVYFTNARGSDAMDRDPSRGESALGATAAAARLGEPTGQIQTSGDGNFENVELGVLGKKKKIPRRVIHFVSGETMEEYSTDEDESDGQEKRDLLPAIDPTKLTWGPYLWFYMLRAATSTLSVCDFLGEKIASLLGVSTPKYQYAIDEYYRMKKEEEEEEEENRMSEEAERQYQEQKTLQTDSTVQTDQPETLASSSFVNLNFEMDGDCEAPIENKQSLTTT